MKVLLFIAVVGLAFGDICDNNPNMATIIATKNAAFAVVDTVMSACNPNGNAFSDLLRSDACTSIIHEGSCYYDNAVSHYGGEEAVTYGTLQSDLGNLESLGNTLCANVEACYTPIKDAVLACDAADPNFRANAIAAAENYYTAFLRSKVQEYAQENSDDVLGTLVEIALNRFTSADDIIETLQEYAAGTDVAADAESAAAVFKQAASDFCEEGCTAETADFLYDIFGRLDAHANCVDASTFCGGCANRATHFLKNRESIPCCLRTVVEYAIQGSTLVQEKYASQIQSITDYISDSFAGKPELLAQIKATKKFVVKQVKCLENVYNGSPNECA